MRRRTAGNEVRGRPGTRVRRRDRVNVVVVHRGEGGSVETHGQGWNRGLDEGRGRGMGMCGTSGAGGIIFGDNFVNCSRQVHKEVILEVSGRTS